MATYPHYAATKGAVIALTKSLATSLAPRIRVNAVAPGMIDTPMTAEHRDSEGGRKTIAQTPLQRMGQPREVAAVVSFLCSDGASFITGQVIHINGGAFMPS
ncbi:SDR family oxidoreductase [Arthrobacter sp. ISL-5]|nr:SDR family oxidoreductase [Arthrobacter sp. ISL-5]